MKGRVIKLVRARGFGFIRDVGGRVIFFHRSELSGADYDALKVGTNVEFDVIRDAEGLQAAPACHEQRHRLGHLTAGG